MRKLDMNKNVIREVKDDQKLQERVHELERQLKEAQTAMQSLSSSGRPGDGDHARQRVEELNAIIQTLHHPVMVYDQNGVIYLANSSAIRAHGFDPTRHHRRDTNQTLIVRYPDGKIANSDDLPSARALKGETVIDEALIITNSQGQEMDILVSSSPLLVNGVQKGVVSVWHDITERKHTEDELRLSEAKYRSLVETAFEGIWTVDLNGRTTFVNPRMAEILKFDSPADLLDRSAFDFVPTEDLEEVIANFRTRLSKNSPEQYDVRLRSRDGSIIWASVTANNILNENGNPTGRMALFMDITERKEAEERLRSARDEAAWLARLPGENPNPVIRVSDEGIVLYCNSSAASLRGWRCAPHALLSRPLLDLVEQAVEQGKMVEQDVTLSEKTYLVSAIPIAGEGYLNLYGRDITERKQAEEALAESERRQREITRLLELDQARLAAIFQHLPVGVWIFDQSGRLVGNNKQAEQIWGGESPVVDSIANYTKYVAWYAENGKLLEPEEYPVAMALRSGQTVEPVELKIRRFDGSEGTSLVSAVPIMSNQGRLTGVIAVQVDISDRKKAEEERRLAEERYTTLFNSVREGFAHYKAIYEDQGKKLIDILVVEINPAGAAISGVARDEQVGKTWRQVWSDVNEKLMTLYQRADETGETIRFDDFNNLTGRIYDVLISRIKPGEFVVTFNDVTERKEFELALHKRESILAQAGEMAHLGAWDIELTDQDDLNANPLVWSDEVYRIFGYAPGEVEPSNELFFERVHPDDRGLVQNSVAQAMAARQAYRIEHRICRPDGEERLVQEHAEVFFDESGNPARIVGAVQDITERKRAEDALRQAEIKYRTLVEQIPNAVTYMDSPDPAIGTFYVSPQIEAMLGYTVKEWQDNPRSWHERLHPEDRERLLASDAYHETSSEPFSLEYRLIARDRRMVWIHDEAVMIRDATGKPLFSQGIMIDITPRKQAEEALRKSEERFAKAFHASPDAIIISRMSDGLIIDVNEGWQELFGHEQSEVLGQTTFDFGIYVNPDDHTAILHRLLEMGYLRDLEVDVRHKSGEIRQASFSGERIEIGDMECLLMVIRDVTERKQAEQALRLSEHRLNRAQEIAHLGSWELDLITNQLTWSDEVYRIFGMQPQEFKATYTSFLEAVHPEDRAAVDAAYFESIRAGRDSYEIDHRVVKRSSGEIRIVHEKCEHFRNQDGQIVRSIGMVHDITERKQAEAALRESEERFRSLADSMPQLVWTALPDGSVDYYNQRYQEYREIKQVEGTAWEWAPVLHPEDVEPTVKAWKRAVETGEVYQIEHRVRLADGSYRWHLSRGVPMLDEQGGILRWFGTATDIHDLKLAQEQLKKYAEQLERSNRELEQFAFMASHDLQEPLRKIEMFGDLLLERAEVLNDRERNYVDRMRNAAGRMRDMVEGLLELSRITTQGQPFIPVDLSQLTLDVLHDLEAQIQRVNGNVDLHGLPIVDGDPLQLRQLMQNLIGNALKYHQPDTTPEVKVYSTTSMETVHIHVEDRGIGFHQEDAERIFQPFHRLVGRSQYEGSGIGLAICRRIVDRHGGEIVAVSKPGAGATLIVTLPIHQPETTRHESRKDIIDE
jgi:PAS domain S-box-containing protein